MVTLNVIGNGAWAGHEAYCLSAFEGVRNLWNVNGWNSVIENVTITPDAPADAQGDHHPVAYFIDTTQSRIDLLNNSPLNNFGAMIHEFAHEFCHVATNAPRRFGNTNGQWVDEVISMLGSQRAVANFAVGAQWGQSNVLQVGDFVSQNLGNLESEPFGFRDVQQQIAMALWSTLPEQFWNSVLSLRCVAHASDTATYLRYWRQASIVDGREAGTDWFIASIGFDLLQIA